MSPKLAVVEVHKIMNHIKQLVAPVATSDNPMDEEMQQSKCTINNNPNCEKFVDSMMTIVGETSCKMTEMEEALQETQEKCESISKEYDGQIEDMQARADDAGVDMALGTKDKNAAELQSRLKQDELQSMDSDFESQMNECETNLQTADETLCGIDSIRMELFKMDGQRPFIQDCEVSEWVLGPCSVPCGGGEQLKTRTIITPPTKGSKCPPLVMRESCNMQECPVNCLMSDWEEWGKCSADCGGGIREHSRTVETEALHGGEPCDVSHISQSCNTFSCDADCQLSMWSDWSSCSKACGGGFQIRRKSVLGKARGEGQCPPKGLKMKEFKRCNIKQCAKNTIKCNSKLDVVLLLDGSGSVGTSGFDATKVFAKKLVEAFNMGQELAQLSVILYSGPRSWTDLQECIKTGAEAKCQLHVVSSLTTDAGPVATAIDKLTWPKSTSFTSGALSMAKTVLKEGRKDAQSVVVVFTHEMPNFKCQTTEAAQELMKSSRVIWVPIGEYVELEEVKKWASKPPRENIIPVKAFTDLAKPEKLRDMIATICPKVV